MQVMMIPFDSFEDMRVGVYDGAHGEPITPPLEKGDPKRGWYLLAVDCAQSTLFEGGEKEDDEPEAVTDRALFILWGRPKQSAVGGNPAPPEPEPKKEEEPEPSEDEADEA